MPIDEKMEKCADVCLQCFKTCIKAISHYLEMGGEHAQLDHLKNLKDCAAICKTTAEFLLNGSEKHGSLCALCDDICVECAVECERFENDQEMAQCARVCRLCAAECEGMAPAA